MTLYVRLFIELFLVNLSLLCLSLCFERKSCNKICVLHKILEIFGILLKGINVIKESSGLPNKRVAKQITSKLQEWQNKLHPNYKSAKNKLES